MKSVLLAAAFTLLGLFAGWNAPRRNSLAHQSPAPAGQAQGYVLEHDADVMKRGPAPHDGGGESTGYNFFDKAPGFKYVFRKRVLHPGAAIGYHPQKEDEIYYVLSGTGTMQMNGKEFPVRAGDGILTRPGSSHGLKQTGKDDLVLIISYEKQ